MKPEEAAVLTIMDAKVKIAKPEIPRGVVKVIVGVIVLSLSGPSFLALDPAHYLSDTAI